jgi:sigma-B regulation protein RsbU (phosphoserine phosphatase)
LLYSDGVTEAHGPDGRQFGQPALVDRLASLAADGAGPDAIVSSIRADLDLFRGPVPLADDLTLLAARLL